MFTASGSCKTENIAWFARDVACDHIGDVTIIPAHAFGVTVASYSCTKMDSTPLVSFERYGISTGSYIGKVILGSFPKMLIIVSGLLYYS